ncbi:MAG: hypothetical protein KUG81_09145 [Gammaproteobacteria bacterium]|nr:hypothetical protein [Gammaproteobacteria bacterium]
MQNNQELHQRAIPSIHHQFVDQWDGVSLTATYLIESSIEGKVPTVEERPVILIPGGFDPIKGSYSENAIRALLATPGISSVYEMHFFAHKKAGYIEVESVIRDLCELLLKGSLRPLLIGMSASTCMLSAAINEASKINTQLNSSGLILVGPYLPDNINLLGRGLAPFYLRKKMQEKLLAHCGHPHLFDNSDRMLQWWKNTPPLREDLKAKRFPEMSQRIQIKTEVLFFKIDTLSWSGKRILKKAYGANVDNPKIPGHHRSLLHIPEFDQMLAACCQKLIAGDNKRIR